MDIEEILSVTGVMEDVAEYRALSHAWNKVAIELLSSVVAQNSKLIGVRNEDLVVACSNNLVCQEIRFRSIPLLKRLKEHGLPSKVRKISFASHTSWKELTDPNQEKRSVLPVTRKTQGKNLLEMIQFLEHDSDRDLSNV